MNGERRGVDRLRAVIDDVANDIESRPGRQAARRLGRPRLATAAVIVLLAVPVATWLLLSSDEGSIAEVEVEVVELKVRGRVVHSAVVEDASTGTILVMPRDPARTHRPFATIPLGVLP